MVAAATAGRAGRWTRPNGAPYNHATAEGSRTDTGVRGLGVAQDTLQGRAHPDERRTPPGATA
eukprot:1455546-Alexandrium_andersonii.AAC.1